MSEQFSFRTRLANVRRLRDELHDVVVIGGGITGAGIALEAAQRGYRTALIEKSDFGSGTSSKSSNLIHGGLRYLAYRRFRFVYQACKERNRLRSAAPDIVRPVPIVVPVYKDRGPTRLELSIGLWLYHLLGLFKSYLKHRMLSADGMKTIEPRIGTKGLLGGGIYYDYITDDARLTLRVVKSAHYGGASVANYVEAIGFVKDGGRVTGVKVVDRISSEHFETRARVVVNAAGPWTDEIRRLDEPDCSPRLRPTKGIHIVVPRERIANMNLVVMTSPADERVVYAIPWGSLCVIGTTDTYYSGDPDNVYAEHEDVQYLIEAVNATFPHARLTFDDVHAAYAGLRPLVDGKGTSEYTVPREHDIFESQSGLVTIAGGKLTTHGAMAVELLEHISRRVGADRRASAPKQTIPIGEEGSDDAFLQAAKSLALDDHVCEHLLRSHGRDAWKILDYVRRNQVLKDSIKRDLPHVWAEVPYSIDHEMTLMLNDFMIRRSRIIYEDKEHGLDAVEAVANLMATAIGWGPAEVDGQLSAYREAVRRTQMFQEASA